MKLKLYHLSIAGMIVFAGCRTAELMSCRVALPDGLTSCGPVTIHQTIHARDIGGAAQGKTVDAGASVAASVAATLRDITASQSGNATGGSDTGDGGTDATADLTDVPLDAEDDQSAAPNGDD